MELLPRFDWMKVYIDQALTDPVRSKLRDFQQAWLDNLLLASLRSARLGYLRFDADLWRIAGAHSRSMWDQHKAAVMAAFKSEEIAGETWIYHEGLLRIAKKQEEEMEKARSRRSSPASHSLSTKNSKSREREKEGKDERDHVRAKHGGTEDVRRRIEEGRRQINGPH